jgi:serine/threonine-protein kinase
LVPDPPSVALAFTRTLVQASAGPQSFGGVVIPGYRPLRVLGEGGMGVVYHAIRTADGVEVAVKMLKTAPGVGDAAVQRFLREARILGKLNHPHIVGFHETGAAGHDPYIVMEFVKGTDASTALKKDGPLPVRMAVAYACQLLDALEYAHGRGFVHRDVKPANMLIEERGGERIVKLADFGLARAYQASQLSGVTLPGDQGGTVAFMAPEQVTHFRDAKAPADQYAAAASIYQLLTDRYVFDFASGVHPLIQILTDEPVPLRTRRKDVPATLAEAVHRALAKEPQERFTDVSAFRIAVRQAT